MAMNSILAATALTSTAAATIFAPALPSPTDFASDGVDPQGWTPKPTGGPDYNPFHNALAKRDGFSNICGYVSGVSAASVQCGPAYCGFNTASSVFGCCHSTTVISGTASLAACDFFTSCVNYNVACNNACQTDTNLAKCASSLPWCQPLAYSGYNTYTNWFCGPSPYTGDSYQPVYSTYNLGAMGSAPVVTYSPVLNPGSITFTTTTPTPTPGPVISSQARISPAGVSTSATTTPSSSVSSQSQVQSQSQSQGINPLTLTNRPATTNPNGQTFGAVTPSTRAPTTAVGGLGSGTGAMTERPGMGMVVGMVGVIGLIGLWL